MIDKIWAKYQKIILGVAIALMSIATLRRISYEFSRLLWGTEMLAGAIDLKQRYKEVLYWFSGKPVYTELPTAVYPPASYTILWPFLGYPSFTFVRWLWAITTVAALIWLIYLLIRESQAQTTMERVFIALMVLSMYATGQTIGNGQLTIHVLVTLVAGITMICRPQTGWVKQILASALIVAGFVKPNLAIPFFWIVLFAPGKLRPALMLGLGYIALALLATSFQEGNIISLHHQWLGRGIEGVSWGSAGGGAGAGNGAGVGYGNLHNWMGALGLSQWNFPVSMLVLLALGLWTYLHRSVDLWLLLGSVAIVSRLWTYHLVYDDMLILLAMVTLFRIAKQGFTNRGNQLLSSGLLAIAVLASLLPASMRLKSPPWDMFFKVGQTSVWIAILIFLLYYAWHQRQAAVNRLS